MSISPILKQAIFSQLDVLVSCRACSDSERQEVIRLIENPSNESSIKTDRALTREEAAKMLGVCALSISRLVSSGKLRGFSGGTGGVSGKKRTRRISFLSVQELLNGKTTVSN